MDIELARTFLKVIEVGSFFKAAEQLFVTQAAVSRRIKVLEGDLGCTLFIRNKAGAVLTTNGRRFAKHAAKLVHTLEQARHEVGVSQPYNRYLAVGGRLGLWQGFLLHFVPIMQAQAPDVVLRTQIGFEFDLTQQLIDGSLDIAVMYTPQRRPGFEVEQLFEDELLLVTSNPEGVASPENYVQVEWGPEFLNQTACFSLATVIRGSSPALDGWLFSRFSPRAARYISRSDWPVLIWIAGGCTESWTHNNSSCRRTWFIPSTTTANRSN